MGAWTARRTGWLMVALGVLGLALSVVVGVWTHLGQRADERGRWSVAVPRRTRAVLDQWLGLVSVEFIAVALAVVVLLALLRHRRSRALAALVVVVGSNITTQITKALLPRPDLGVGSENSLPSGHVTVVTSLVLATVLVVPAGWRRATALLAAGAATLTGAAVVIERWHRPSDVVAAYGVCAVFAGLGLVLADRTSRRIDTAWTGPIPVGRRGSSVVRHGLPALMGAVLAGAFLVLAGLVAHERPSNLVVGVAVLTATALVCVAVVALTTAALDALPAAPRRAVGPRR